jgi:hypothetical protein
MGEEGIMIYICSFWLVPKYFSIKVNQCCGAGAESRGAEITLPTGAGAEIKNCGSGSYLFTTDSKKYYRINHAEEIFGSAALRGRYLTTVDIAVSNPDWIRIRICIGIPGFDLPISSPKCSTKKEKSEQISIFEVLVVFFRRLKVSHVA